MTTIYHNPRCSKSRETLERIRAHGIEPHIIEYLKTPPSRDTLLGLVAAMGVNVRDIIRTKEPVYAELGLGEPNWTDEALVEQMVENPELIERPIVVTTKGTRLCRPPETVDEILEPPAAT